ncbi:hypothetical protein TCELL_1156 [Thermogladius calderae 1633]|uniref:Alcohol dehydrogenase GroES domain protein n=1 Tax=Thermogladius calderae (strain DSM 22663 / VKM B-2946 / 1633) TaxID=1184251 RepID=I3TFP1_THEC1|nr:hypothetical protein [Thermogladius calderae]AFK51579.1 hypothetical protein TCELL_1156 [Thermogladius calderae 1633]
MRNKAVVYDGSLAYADLPAVVLNRGMVLVKNSMAYVGFQDEELLEGREPVILPRLLGSVCAGRVIESPEQPYLTGKFVVTNPLVSGSRSVLDVDGCLSTYFQVDPKRVYGTYPTVEPVNLLEPYASHALELAGESEGNTLVLGCNIVGLMTATALRDRGFEPYLLCEKSLAQAKRLGLRVFRNVGDLPVDLETLVVVEVTPALWDLADRSPLRRLVVSGFSGTRSLRLGLSRELVVVYLDTATPASSGGARRLAEKALGLVKVFNVKSVEDAVGFLPPRGLGTILRLSGPGEKSEAGGEQGGGASSTRS